MVTFSGHAYAWDVLGDPAFSQRVADSGVDRVTLAATYHSTRATTPLHPRHRHVDAHYAALYRPVRESAWKGRRLRPLSPVWMDSADPFAEAVSQLDLPVNAWIVLTHNTRLGREFSELSVVNWAGDSYPYALCPSHEEVRDYAALLAAEAVRDVPVAGISLEACGQLGVVHMGHHEKGSWSPAQERALSVCCCSACRRGWISRGADPAEVIAALGALDRGKAEGVDTLANLPGSSDVVLATRHAAADLLRRQVLAGLPKVEITLHANPDPWATGASPGLTPTAASDVDVLLVPAWPTTQASADAVAAAARFGARDNALHAAQEALAAGRRAVVDAYVTVLPPADPTLLADHVQRLVKAGASRLSLYHLGLTADQALFAQLTGGLS